MQEHILAAFVIVNTLLYPFHYYVEVKSSLKSLLKNQQQQLYSIA
jgi:hypothetical protein